MTKIIVNPTESPCTHTRTVESSCFVKLLPREFALGYGSLDLSSKEVSPPLLRHFRCHKLERSSLLQLCYNPNLNRVIFVDFINLVDGNLFVIFDRLASGAAFAYMIYGICSQINLRKYLN